MYLDHTLGNAVQKRTAVGDGEDYRDTPFVLIRRECKMLKDLPLILNLALRGCPETLARYYREIKRPPYGNA